MSNSFIFQGEEAAAGHTGAKEKVAAKKTQRLWAMKHPQHQQKRFSLLSSPHREFYHFWELMEWRKTSGWRFHRDGPACSRRWEPTLLTKLLQARPCRSCCFGWDALGTPVTCPGTLPGQQVTGKEGGFSWPIVLFARSWHSSPKAFVFQYLMCYCNAVNIWADFWCRTSPSALC